MARGRMLNNSISRSLKFDLLPDDTCRLLATWIISHLDFRGVFYADAIMVKSLVFTRRSDVTDEQVEEYLQAMVEIGLITLFEAKEQRWQCWPEFAANQVGLRTEREKTDFPVPPDYLSVPVIIPPDNGEETAGGRLDDGKIPAEEESKLTEGQSQGELKDIAPSAATAPPSSPNGIFSTESGGVVFAGSKSKPEPKPKRKSPKSKAKTPEAVKVFRENAHRYPVKAWYSDIAEAVGEKPADLELWGRVVKAYVGCGWNPGNVKNMLDFYGRREIPATKGQHKNAGAQPHAGIRQWLTEQGVEAQ